MMQALSPAVLASLERAVVDTGYDHPRQIVAVEKTFALEGHLRPAAPATKEGAHRGKKPESRGAAPAQRQAAYQEVRTRMKEQAASPAGQAWLKLRRMTVGPVFGLIKIGAWLSGFMLRGLAKVDLEW